MEDQKIYVYKITQIEPQPVSGSDLLFTQIYVVPIPKVSGLKIDDQFVKRISSTAPYLAPPIINHAFTKEDLNNLKVGNYIYCKKDETQRMVFVKKA